MSPSLESAHDDQHLIRYLLGQLSDEEAERLDEMSITDDETAARLRVVEDDLVDAYVRGVLPPEVRERFERVYLATPRRRERVEFAQQFRRALETPGTPAADPAPVRPTPPDVARPLASSDSASVSTEVRVARPPGRWLAWAAAILAITCGGLLVEQLRLRSGLDEALRQNAALDARAESLSRALSAAQTAIAGTVTSAHPAAAPQAPGNVTGARSAALVLMPDTRAASTAPTLTLTASDRDASFRLRLEPGDFSRYEVSLRDPATSRDIWNSGEIHVSRDAAAPSLALTVPAQRLKAQHYSFTVTAASGNGRREVVGSYTFEVQR